MPSYKHCFAAVSSTLKQLWHNDVRDLAMTKQRFPKPFINDLISRIDIVDHADVLLPLKKNGRDYVTNCVFHEEKSSSLSFSREKQFFHCFGCGKHGDVITLHMQVTGLDFVSTVETLAKEYNVPIPKPGDQSSSSEVSAEQKLKAGASKLFRNIQNACTSHELTEAESLMLEKIKKKWGVFNNVTPLFWGGSAYGNGLLNGMTKDALMDAILYCGVDIKTLKTPTPLLAFFNKSGDVLTGIVTPNGDVWSSNPDVPVIGVNSETRDKTDAIEVFISDHQAFNNINQDRHVAFMGEASWLNIRPLSKATLQRYSDKIIFHIPEKNRQEAKNVWDIYSDGDLMYVSHDHKQEPIGIVSYIRNLITSRVLLAVYEDPDRIRDINLLVDENMVDIDIKPSKHRFSSLMIRRQVTDFVEHASSKYNLTNAERASSAQQPNQEEVREVGVHALKQPRV